MKSLLVVAALILGIPQANPIPSTLVEGVVRDVTTGLPLNGVSVTLTSEVGLRLSIIPPASPLKSGISDEQGHFAIGDINPGRYRVVPEKTGFVFALRPELKVPRDPGVWIQISQGQKIPPIKLNMAKQSVISGRVIDEKGQPFVSTTANVALMRHSYDNAGVRRLSVVAGIKYPNAAGSFVRMNDKGEYRFYGVPAGDYYIQVSGGPIGGTPPKIPVVVFYPGTIDESKALMVHVEAGDEIHLGTMAFQQVDATQVRLRIKDLDGSPPGTRTIRWETGLLIQSMIEQTVSFVVKPGHYNALVTTSSSYGHAIFDAGSADIEQEVVMLRGIRVKLRFSIEDETGKRTPYIPAITSFSCGLISESTHALSQCYILPRSDGIYVGAGLSNPGVPASIPPDSYRLEFSQMPDGMFVRGATISDRDVLRTPIAIDQDLDIEVALSMSDAEVHGGVQNSNGESVPDAVVALIPDNPHRNAGDLYRSAVTDSNGNFELYGIAPGNYRLFAWQELDGAAYRNSEFMKEYDERGKPIQIQKDSRTKTTLTVF